MPDDWDEEVTSSTDVSELREKLAGAPRPCLTVLTGPSSGHVFKVVQGNSVIGRAPNAEIKVVDDGISRAHARLRAEGQHVWVEDFGSRNGTFVNGTKLQGPCELQEGDKLQIGRGTVLRFAFQDNLDESFHENLMSSALRDGLTKLFNKRYFIERLDSELKFAQRHETAVSLLMLDLDNFKKVNDTLGHVAGDTVLSSIATALSKAVRNEDVVARFGGEEFVVVLRAIAVEQAAGMAERLRRLVEQTTIKHEGKEIHTTVSIGVAGYPTMQARLPNELVEAADKALYRAKNAGRNRVSQ